ncbi:hypothetical protein OPKNFCMD_1953 [Methylobacterium crusticola]|uniref:Uncharacterized protein n=1 Tax=Methylobacterium crusticola TaxID=1697972 RepID=A0ABQ4QV58_9HYPH|nr:hypothetical protein [Methylobacterium crusticola]GJD49223.1 hypothetical protein OPKNFCMD_1953 [Methylobacterium crusticola]
MRIPTSAALALLALPALLPPPAARAAPAQPLLPAAPAPRACPEGRLADGRCVDPLLSAYARQQTVCFTQVRLSYVSCPGVLPALDTRYRYPFTVVTERQREINILFERQGYQNVFGLVPVTRTGTTTGR